MQGSFMGEVAFRHERALDSCARHHTAKEVNWLEKFVIQGGARLTGEVTIGGAKNAVVAIIPATILAKGRCVIGNIPNISDVNILLKMLSEMGASVSFLDKTTVEIDTTHIVNPTVPYDLARYLRAKS